MTNPDSEVVATIYHGDIVTRTGINTDVGWSRVKYGEQTLYCISSYVYVVEEEFLHFKEYKFILPFRKSVPNVQPYIVCKRRNWVYANFISLKYPKLRRLIRIFICFERTLGK